MYTAAITSFKGYSDDINKQISNVGALTARLEMTKNRVRDQKDNVKILADENINADLSETALDFKNAQLALEAAQMAAGKIMKLQNGIAQEKLIILNFQRVKHLISAKKMFVLSLSTLQKTRPFL